MYCVILDALDVVLYCVAERLCYVLLSVVQGWMYCVMHEVLDVALYCVAERLCYAVLCVVQGWML